VKDDRSRVDQKERSGLKDAGQVQPLSALRYALIALVGLLLALGFTGFYIYEVPRLVQNGIQSQLFYILLIPWGLSSAAFLFGAMRTYAKLTYKHLGGVLELGGPVVLFCLIVLGGFKLVPPPPPTFDLAVRAHSADSPLIVNGQVTLDLPGLPHASIGSDGEANFKSLSTIYQGKPIKILPQIDGYEKKWLIPTIDGNILNITLEKEHPSIDLVGSIIPIPTEAKKTIILVEGQKGETSPDELGRFTLTVNGKAGDVVRVVVHQKGKLVYYDDEQLPGPITLKLRKLR
jgi:hypothetical protein